MRRNPFDTVQSPFITALFHPLNLAILALAIAAGLCSWWGLFPVGMVIWGIMFLIIYRDPTIRFRHQVLQRTALAKRFQDSFDRVERSQVALFNAMAHARPSIRRILQPVQDSVGQLVDQAYRLCVRMTALENHRLVTQANHNQDNNRSQIEQKIAGTTDPAAKKEYEEAIQSLDTKDTNIQAISTLLDRTDAQLSSLASALDGLLTDVIRVQILDANAMRGEIPGLLGKAKAQADQLMEFEDQAARSQV
jgi:hypothetical protein